MIQITAMNSAKPAPSGVEKLAGMPGEGQDSSGFEDVLSTQMEGTEPAKAGAGEAHKPASGKATGKAGGKILPASLPEGEETLPVERKADALLSLQAAETEEETSDTPSQQAVADQAPLVLVPLLAAAQQVSAEADAGESDITRGSRSPLPQATTATPPVPQAETPAAAGQDVKALLARLAQAFPGESGKAPAQAAGNLPVQAAGNAVAAVAGETGQPSQSVQSLPIQALSAQSVPVQTVAVGPAALSGGAIRLFPAQAKIQVKGGDAAPAAALAADSTMSDTVPAEDAAPLLATPGEEAVPTTSTPARQMARAAGLSAKERFEMPQQLSGAAMEGRQEAQGWFGSSANTNTQLGAAMPTAQSVQAGERPHDFAALVDRLVAAREFATPAPVYAAINHADFGEVSLKFEHGDHGLSVAVSSPDPDFARAVQAAAPSDRGGAGQDSREGGSAGNSAAFRQDAQAQSFGSGAQSQSRNADGGDRQGSELRQLPREAPASAQAETGKPRQNGIFA